MMKRTATLSLPLILTCVLLAGCSLAASPSGISLPYRRHTRNIETPIIFEGRVVGVQDGDTISVLDLSDANHRIRLLGIDAPEKGQAFGNRSGENLSQAIFNRVVTIGWSKHDRYGRIVGKVVLEGQDICLEQVRAGFAWHFKRYEDEQSEEDRKSYDAAEQEARSAKKGLWKDLIPLEPWLYREQQRDHSQASKFIPDVPDTSRTSEVAPVAEEGNIRGNRRSMIYHWPGCPNYDDIAPHNRVPFTTRQEAEQAGYRAARNCR